MRRLNVESLLQVKKRGVFEPTVANEVIQLVARLNDVEIQNIVGVDYVLLLENADVSVDVQILEVLLPLVEANHLHDRHQNFLQTLVDAV